MNFKLRPWKLDDLDNLVKHANNPKIAKFLTNQFPHPYRVEDGKKFIEQIMEKAAERVLAIEVNGEAAGGIGIHPKDDIYCKNAELGYWLAEPYWGKGIMTKAIDEMVEFGFKTMDIGRIYATPYGTNIGSQKVLEKAGFTLEATLKKILFKNGEYLDELIYAKRRK